MSCVRCLARHLCYCYGEPREDYSCELFREEEEESQDKEWYKELTERANQIALSYWKQCCKEIEERRRKIMEEKLNGDDLFGGAFNLEELGIEEVDVNESKKEEKAEAEEVQTKTEEAEKKVEEGTEDIEAPSESPSKEEHVGSLSEERAESLPEDGSDNQLNDFIHFLQIELAHLSQVAEDLYRIGISNARVLRFVERSYLVFVQELTDTLVFGHVANK